MSFVNRYSNTTTSRGPERANSKELKNTSSHHLERSKKFKEMKVNYQFLVRFGVIAFIAGNVYIVGSFLSSYNEQRDVDRSLSRQISVATSDDTLSCPQTSDIYYPGDIVIDYQLIQDHTPPDHHKLSDISFGSLSHFTTERNSERMLHAPGVEHYRLLYWLVDTYHIKADCRHVADIGTKFVDNALALGAGGASVKTFDTPTTSNDRIVAFGSITENEWQSHLTHSHNIHIKFYNLDLLTISDADFRRYMSTWIIVLGNTPHKPYSDGFERQFLKRLLKMKPKFRGILLIDDINANDEMRDWWQEIVRKSRRWTSRYRKRFVPLNVTNVGHVSGTGLLDFSGKVVIRKDHHPKTSLLSDKSQNGGPRQKRGGDTTCLPTSTKVLFPRSITIDATSIRDHAHPKQTRLDEIKQFTTTNYQKFMLAMPGREHYTLLNWLTHTYHTKEDCRHVVDIGTRYVASALALGATGVPVKSFDIPTSKERQQAFGGIPEEEWQTKLRNSQGIDIEFYNVDLLTISDEDFQEYMSTWLILLDTFHVPYSKPFEREFLDRLLTMKPKFEGIVLLDDINLNKEMRKWWIELKRRAKERGYVAHDLTEVGHFSGTGLLDFSGKVVVNSNQLTN